MKTSKLAFGILVAGFALAANAGEVEAREDALSAGRVIIPGNSLIKISADRKDALYRCGEETEFSVTVKTKHTHFNLIVGLDNARTKWSTVYWRHLHQLNLIVIHSDSTIL